MNFLVTGGAGFVGTNLIKRLKSDNHNIVSLDNYSAGKKSNHINDVQYIEAGTYDLDSIEHLLSDIDGVFHLGEYSRIAPSFEEIDRVWKYNTLGTFKVLEYCRKNNLKIVYAGSSTKFANEGISHSPYSFTKSNNIDLLKGYSKWYDLKYGICYFYNVFGPGYDSSPVKGYESVVSVFENQYKNNIPLTITGDGSQERMFTYVEDIVDGLVKCFFYEENEEFELANTKTYSILQVAKLFSDNIKFIDKRPGDRKNSIAVNIEDTRRKLNWNSTIDLEEWIKKIK